MVHGDKTASFAGYPIVTTDQMKPPFRRWNWPDITENDRKEVIIENITKPIFQT
jgi:hypothetical protein